MSWEVRRRREVKGREEGRQEEVMARKEDEKWDRKRDRISQGEENGGWEEVKGRCHKRTVDSEEQEQRSDVGK